MPRGGSVLLGDATTGIAPTTSKRVGGPDHVDVKEPRTPHLTGDECAAEDADEEAEGDQTFRTGDQACESCGDSTA